MSFASLVVERSPRIAGSDERHPIAARTPTGLGGPSDREAGAPRVVLVTRHVRPFERLELAGVPGHAIHVLTAKARHLQVSVPAGWTTLWMPLAGTIGMDVAGFQWHVAAGEVLLWRERSLRMQAHRADGWIAICGSHEAWLPLLAPTDHRTPLLSHQHACSRPVRRLVVSVARAARRGLAGGGTGLVALREALLVQQRTLRDLLPRCSGRSSARRRLTLTRLLWVRHLIERSEDARIDLEVLAASANYSSCHLIRSYREVFGETPTEHGSRLRYERALKLVLETRMPVCEITEAVGFQSQSAFCRAFKNLYGMTTSEARQRSHEDADT
jgi:AraC family transcriptional regulator